MSYNVAHINVHDCNGYFHQIFQVKGVLNFNPRKFEKEQARAIVKDSYPNYRKAELVVMHYDKNNYNDKNNVVEL